MRFFVSIAIVALGTAQAQDLKQSATEHFSNQQWEAALADYQALVDNNAADSADWYNLGFCQMQLKQYESAAANFEEAKSRGINASFADFNRSKAYALLGKEDKMYAAMEEGLKDGLAAYGRYKSDEAFAKVLDEARFQKLLEKVKINAFPCLGKSEMRHLDFWLGEWHVHYQGQVVGRNVITMAEGGCAIHENYTTAGSYSGQSINYFDPLEEKWHQHWVGSGGDVYNYIESKREPGLLQFTSPYLDPAGKRATSRLTFTLNEDETVTQMFETSYDNGSTWSAGFIGLYKKVGLNGT